MDWERIDSTISTQVQLFRKRGSGGQFHDVVDLIAKDPVPDLDAMTEPQLCEYAAVHHIAIPEGLEREELIDLIKNSLEANWEERLRSMRGLLDYVYQDGPHPLQVYRRIVAITKAVRPDLLLNMSCAQLAILCDDGKGDSSDGRATVSARIKRMFDPVKKAGMKGFKAPFQKTDSACRNYSDSAKGNQNRLGSGYLALNGHKKKAIAA
jgi:hypothetical protein